MEIEIRVSGSCRSRGKLANSNLPWRYKQFPAAFGIISEDGKPPVLYDTGYAPRVSEGMRIFPFTLYHQALPIRHSRRLAVDYVREKGWEADQVSLIILSHFHPDHIGGIKDFPNARFLCSRAAFNWVRNRRGFAALRRGYLPSLLPEDFEERAIWVEDMPAASLPASDIEMQGWDLSTLGLRGLALDLPGHVPGQIGLWLANAQDPTFFIADAIWDQAALSTDQMPYFLAMLVHDDRRAYKETVTNLRKMRACWPDIRFVPTHDPALPAKYL